MGRVCRIWCLLVVFSFSVDLLILQKDVRLVSYLRDYRLEGVGQE